MCLVVAIRSSHGRLDSRNRMRFVRGLIFLLMSKQPNSLARKARVDTPGWSMPDISCETSQTSRFSAPSSFALSSSGRTKRRGGKEERTSRKGERERDEDSEPCGCYLVMHGSVIATIQPAYKRGSVSIPLSAT